MIYFADSGSKKMRTAIPARPTINPAIDSPCNINHRAIGTHRSIGAREIQYHLVSSGVIEKSYHGGA